MVAIESVSTNTSARRVFLRFVTILIKLAILIEAESLCAADRSILWFKQWFGEYYDSKCC